MVTTVTTETLYEGSTIIVKQVSVDAASDATSVENVVIDLSTIVGPEGQGNSALNPTGRVSLMECTWDIDPVWEGAKLYWHDEGNDALAVQMNQESAIDFRGIGGKHYVAEVEAGDGDVLLDLTNVEAAAGSASFVFVFKKKQ